MTPNALAQTAEAGPQEQGGGGEPLPVKLDGGREGAVRERSALALGGALAGPGRTGLWEGGEEPGCVGGQLRVCIARRASELVMSDIRWGK